ncbi:MAG: carbon storage regulator [Zhaonellaceae bacterium]
MGEDIKITVISIEGDKVKLGIEAPENLNYLPRGNLRSYKGRKQRGCSC